MAFLLYNSTTRLIIGIFGISLFYAWFETVFDWSRVAIFFVWLPRFGVVWGYTYLFMPIYILFFVYISHFGKTWEHYFLSLSLFSFIEDIFYWIINLRLPTPSDWTNKVIGYTYFKGIYVPNWYFLSISISVFLILKLYNKISFYHLRQILKILYREKVKTS